MAQTEAEVARRTETIMFQADKDGDGVISFDGTRINLYEALPIII